MDNLLIFLIVIIAAAVMALVAYIIHRFMHPKLKEEKKDEQEMIKEELDRVLVPIEDEKAAEEISNYKDKEDDK